VFEFRLVDLDGDLHAVSLERLDNCFHRGVSVPGPLGPPRPLARTIDRRALTLPVAVSMHDDRNKSGE
jgi:hypothetical protein